MSNENTPKDEEAMADEWAAALSEQTSDAADDWAAAMAEQENDDAQRVELDELRDEGRRVDLERPNLDVIFDIPVTISMEVGHTEISIRNLLQLNQGSVVELDRMAGEPLDVLVNGTLIAHGEVVVVNERFGIRLTDVISPSERIKKLR